VHQLGEGRHGRTELGFCRITAWGVGSSADRSLSPPVGQTGPNAPKEIRPACNALWMPPSLWLDLPRDGLIFLPCTEIGSAAASDCQRWKFEFRKCNSMSQKERPRMGCLLGGVRLLQHPDTLPSASASASTSTASPTYSQPRLPESSTDCHLASPPFGPDTRTPLDTRPQPLPRPPGLHRRLDSRDL